MLHLTYPARVAEDHAAVGAGLRGAPGAGGVALAVVEQRALLHRELVVRDRPHEVLVLRGVDAGQRCVQ